MVAKVLCLRNGQLCVTAYMLFRERNVHCKLAASCRIDCKEVEIRLVATRQIGFLRQALADLEKLHVGLWRRGVGEEFDRAVRRLH